ncbi:uncharacterized protein VTP21DRAFT_1005 [Calcarisporiella thermophila]|uniref:uncharacterized protein n=1 Tax=Calcarisporiella thermophila TaxID=911321 RepID=UPI003742516E
MDHEWESQVGEPFSIAIPAFLKEKPMAPPPVLVENELQPGLDRNKLVNSSSPQAAPFPMEMSRSATLSLPMTPNNSNGQRTSAETGIHHGACPGVAKYPASRSHRGTPRPILQLFPGNAAHPNLLLPPPPQTLAALAPARLPLSLAVCPTLGPSYAVARQIVSRECEPPPHPNLISAPGSMIPAPSLTIFSFSSPPLLLLFSLLLVPSDCNGSDANKRVSIERFAHGENRREVFGSRCRARGLLKV